MATPSKTRPFSDLFGQVIHCHLAAVRLHRQMRAAWPDSPDAAAAERLYLWGLVEAPAWFSEGAKGHG